MDLVIVMNQKAGIYYINCNNYVITMFVINCFIFIREVRNRYSWLFIQSLSCPVLPVLSCQSCPVLSCPVLSCPVLSCPVLSCPVLSCPGLPVLSCPVLSCLVLSCLVLSCLVLSCLVLSCLVLSCLVLSCLVLSCLAAKICPTSFPLIYVLYTLPEELNLAIFTTL